MAKLKNLGNFAQIRPKFTIAPPLEGSRRALARGDNKRLRTKTVLLAGLQIPAANAAGGFSAYAACRRPYYLIGKYSKNSI